MIDAWRAWPGAGLAASCVTLSSRSPSAHAFEHEAMARIRRVVAADGYCFSTADPDSLAMTSHATDGVDRALSGCLYESE